MTSHISSSSNTAAKNEPNSITMNTMPTIENTSELISLDTILSSSSNNRAAALCNDPSGLCLGSRGKIDTSRSGLYTKIIRLASHLDPYDRKTNSRDSTHLGTTSNREVSGGISSSSSHTESERDMNTDTVASQSQNDKNSMNTKSSTSTKNELDFPLPFVSIETDCASTFIKEYDGHAIVLRVPTEVGELQPAQGDNSQIVTTLNSMTFDNHPIHVADGNNDINSDKKRNDRN